MEKIDLTKLHEVCRDFLDRLKISCEDAVCEDRVYENAPDLVAEIGKTIGFYHYPDENEEG